MNCLENKEFITFELKPLIKDCLSSWINNEYDDDTIDAMTTSDVEEINEIEIPDDVIETIYDATINLIKDDEDYDIHISRNELKNIIMVEWNIYKEDFIQQLYEYIERDNYTDDDLY